MRVERRQRHAFELSRCAPQRTDSRELDYVSDQREVTSSAVLAQLLLPPAMHDVIGVHLSYIFTFGGWAVCRVI